ncbi:MAG: DUF4129 domain-containing protein [Terrimesophilobacter sp.]
MTILTDIGANLANLDVPVDPNADQAQQWIVGELAKPEYQAAQPSWFDRVSEAFWNWLNSLDLSGGGAAQAPLLAVFLIVIVAVVIAAIIIFGIPRINRKSAVTRSLLDDDQRTSATLRASAEDAASQGLWDQAIEELFRAIAKSLIERGLLFTSPGTTAHDFSASAADLFPEFASQLIDGGVLFDNVRYLEKPGTQEGYDQLVALEQELRTNTPSLSAIR